MGLPIELVAVWVACGVVSALISENRDNGTLYNFIWLLLGFTLGPLGVVLAFAIAGRGATCGYCRKSLHPEALKCPYCQTSFSRKAAR